LLTAFKHFTTWRLAYPAICKIPGSRSLCLRSRTPGTMVTAST